MTEKEERQAASSGEHSASHRAGNRPKGSERVTPSNSSPSAPKTKLAERGKAAKSALNKPGVSATPALPSPQQTARVGKPRAENHALRRGNEDEAHELPNFRAKPFCFMATVLGHYHENHDKNCRMVLDVKDVERERAEHQKLEENAIALTKKYLQLEGIATNNYRVGLDERNRAIKAEARVRQLEAEAEQGMADYRVLLKRKQELEAKIKEWIEREKMDNSDKYYTYATIPLTELREVVKT